MTPQDAGRQYLGRGVYMFDTTSEDPLPMPNRGLVVDVADMDDDEIDVQTLGETGIREVFANSFAEFTHKWSIEAGLKGSYQGFSGSLKSKYSNTVRRSTTTKYMRISNVVTCDAVSIGTDPDVFKDWLTEDFKRALATKPAAELFSEYGTHVALGVKVGGSANYSCYSVETKSLDEYTFRISAEAGFKSKGGSISGSTALTDEEKRILNNVQGDIALEVRGGGPGEAQALRQNKPAAWSQWAVTVKESPAFMGFPAEALVPIWKFVSDQQKRQALELAYKKLAAQHMPVEIFWKTLDSPSALPDASVVIPDGYKLLCGGAFIPDKTTNGEGVLLTASFPESDNRWRAMGKWQVKPDTAPLTVYAMALYDPDDLWETKIFSSTSDKTEFPNDSAIITDGSYVLVGGGARVNWSGAGNLLTTSYPDARAVSVGSVPLVGPVTVPLQLVAPAWRANSKDHVTRDDATLTTYAIGLRSKLPGVSLQPKLVMSRSPKLPHPSAEATPAAGYMMVGGGARVNWTGKGNLLTASYPLDSTTWKASSKDHVESDEATIDAFALGVKVSVS